MSVPNWVKDAIFYQIFPDRFARGDDQKLRPTCDRWGAVPTVTGFQGGDLQGIIRKLDYLLDLGVTAIYLNPIFQSPSTHRYNTTDYYQIDPYLGTFGDFQQLVKTVHENGMRLILDGVFNHCGRGFFAFADLLENQQHSRYRDWFHVLRFPVDAFSPGEAKSYKAWWNIKSLPKFNTDNRAVRDYLLGVARYWTDQGIDGWRLDVPNEIDDDSFWAEFRSTVRASNPDAYLVGEIWNIEPRWANEGHFDGLMNYPLRSLILEWAQGKTKADQLSDGLETLLAAYPLENTLAMYNLVGSHDVERYLTLLKGDLQRAKLGYAFLFSFPGIPAIYYGDEVGMVGGKDPDCRRAFPWNPDSWNLELRTFIQHLISLRKSLLPLRAGNLQMVYEDSSRNTLAFSRSTGDEQVIIVLNGSEETQTLYLPLDIVCMHPGQEAIECLSGSHMTATGEGLQISLPALQAGWIRSE